MKRDQRREFFYNKTLKVEVHKYSYIDISLWRDFVVYAINFQSL